MSEINHTMDQVAGGLNHDNDEYACILDAAIGLTSLGSPRIPHKRVDALEGGPQQLAQSSATKDGHLAEVKEADPPSIINSEPPHLQYKYPKDLLVQLSFPETLYKVLSDPSNDHIISWLPHGKGFIIRDKKLFESILNKHFDRAKFTSFTRRLKRWHFVRVSEGPDSGAFVNPQFIKGRPDLVSSMIYGLQASVGGDHQVVADHKNRKNTPSTTSAAATSSTESNDEDIIAAAVEEVQRRRIKLQQQINELQIRDQKRSWQEEQMSHRERYLRHLHERELLHFTDGNFPQKRLKTRFSSEYGPEDRQAFPMVQPNVIELASGSLSDDSSHDAHSFDRNNFAFGRTLNLISPMEDEQQQCPKFRTDPPACHPFVERMLMGIKTHKEVMHMAIKGLESRAPA